MAPAFQYQSCFHSSLLIRSLYGNSYLNVCQAGNRYLLGTYAVLTAFSLPWVYTQKQGRGHAGMKIIIYLDILLLVNFLTGYLLLCAAVIWQAAKHPGCVSWRRPGRRGRVAADAASAAPCTAPANEQSACGGLCGAHCILLAGLAHVWPADGLVFAAESDCGRQLSAAYPFAAGFRAFR